LRWQYSHTCGGIPVKLSHAVPKESSLWSLQNGGPSCEAFHSMTVLFFGNERLYTSADLSLCCNTQDRQRGSFRHFGN